MASPSIAHRKEEILGLLEKFRQPHPGAPQARGPEFRQRPALAPPADEPRVKTRTKEDRPPAAQPEVEPPLRRASRREKQLRSARAAVDRLLEDAVPAESTPSVVPVARRLLAAPRGATPPPRRPPSPRAEAPAPDRGSAERARAARARRAEAERARAAGPRLTPGPRRARATESPDVLEEPMLLALLALLALQL